jgi:hypothetical protein
MPNTQSAQPLQRMSAVRMPNRQGLILPGKAPLRRPGNLPLVVLSGRRVRESRLHTGSLAVFAF